MQIPASSLVEVTAKVSVSTWHFDLPKDITLYQRRKLDKFITLFNHGTTLRSLVGLFRS